MAQWQKWEFLLLGGLAVFCLYTGYVYLQDRTYLFAVLQGIFGLVMLAMFVQRLLYQPVEVGAESVQIARDWFGCRNLRVSDVEKIVVRRRYSPLVGRSQYIDDILLMDSRGREFIVERLWNGVDRHNVKEALVRGLPEARFVSEETAS